MIDLIVIGKTAFDYLDKGISEYSGRLKYYTRFDLKVLPDVKGAKSMSKQQIIEREGEMLVEKLSAYDCVILLDEGGKEFSSRGFADFLERKSGAFKKIAFVIGGAYGFSDKVYALTSEKLSLSKMTFSHQLVRVVFLEQLYRAFTIIKGEPYHHD